MGFRSCSSRASSALQVRAAADTGVALRRRTLESVTVDVAGKEETFAVRPPPPRAPTTLSLTRPALGVGRWRWAFDQRAPFDQRTAFDQRRARQVLRELEFTSDRKRMSVLLRADATGVSPACSCAPLPVRTARAAVAVPRTRRPGRRAVQSEPQGAGGGPLTPAPPPRRTVGRAGGGRGRGGGPPPPRARAL